MNESLPFPGLRHELVVGILVAVILTALGLIWRWAYRRVESRVARGLKRPTLVYVSTGGSCRDPMAKVITERLIMDRRPRVRVVAAGLVRGSSKRPSKAARLVVQEGMKKDLLKNHRTRYIDDALAAEADLILAMEPKYVDEIVKAFPFARSKTYTIHSFLGLSGKIENPWRAPDEMDEKTLTRYRSCFGELQQIITANIDRIYAGVTLRLSGSSDPARHLPG